MRTLHVGLRVSDLEQSLAFYAAVGYTVAGTVAETAFGSLTMLRLPGDDFVTIELVHDPARGKVDLGTGLSHLVIQVAGAVAGRPCRWHHRGRLRVSRPTEKDRWQTGFCAEPDQSARRSVSASRGRRG